MPAPVGPTRCRPQSAAASAARYTAPKTGTQGGNHYDYSAIEESTVSTVGNTADAPTKGLQINVILKSGGDQFHGNGAFFGTNHHLEFDNVNDTLRARGITGGNPVNVYQC